MSATDKPVRIYDTTLRDGTQGEGFQLSVLDKLRIAERLDDFGMDYIEGGWPGSNPKDIEFFAEAAKRSWRHARVAAFGSTRRAGVAVEDDAQVSLLLEAATPVVTIFGKSWEMHVTEVLRTTVEENRAMIRDTVAWLKRHGREVVYDAEHFFDGYKESPDHALATLEAAAEGGADCLVLCDTNGGSLPTEVLQICTGGQGARCPDVPFGIHTHNDCELGVANAIAAVKAGALQVQGTINGYGERTGNCNLTSVIPDPPAQDGTRRGPRLGRTAGSVVLRRRRLQQPALPPRAVRRQDRLLPQGRHARQRGPEARPQLRAHPPGGGRQRANDPRLRTQRPVEHPDQGGATRLAARQGQRRRPRRWSPASRTSRTKATRSRPPAARSSC